MDLRILTPIAAALAIGLIGCAEKAAEPTTNTSTTASGTSTSPESSTAELQWAESWDNAVQRAKAENKLVMLKFTAEW